MAISVSDIDALFRFIVSIPYLVGPIGLNLFCLVSNQHQYVLTATKQEGIL